MRQQPSNMACIAKRPWFNHRNHLRAFDECKANRRPLVIVLIDPDGPCQCPCHQEHE